MIDHLFLQASCMPFFVGIGAIAARVEISMIIFGISQRGSLWILPTLKQGGGSQGIGKVRKN